jgi:hypothetical protein
MRRNLAVTMAALALLIVAIPGPAAASARKAVADDCRQHWVDAGFRNQGHCMRHAGKAARYDYDLYGQIRFICEASGGTYASPGTVDGTTVTQMCTWLESTEDARKASLQVIEFCGRVIGKPVLGMTYPIAPIQAGCITAIWPGYPSWPPET